MTDTELPDYKKIAEDRRKNFKLLSQLQTIEMMLAEAYNELTKDKVLDRIFTRMELAGKLDKQSQQARYLNQTRMRSAELSIKFLEDLQQTEVEFAEKEKKGHNEEKH